MKKGILNVFFRGLTLGLKFLFVLFLGRYSPDEINLGIYGLIVTSIALLIYLIGFDFYIFNTREIITDNREKLSSKVVNQFFFHLIGYLLVIPLSTYILIKFEVIPGTYLWVFLFLVIVEHLGQEYYRLLTAFEKSILANILLFLRSGLWVFVVLFDFFILKNPLVLKKYIFIWFCFSLVSTIISSIIFAVKFNIRLVPIELAWILKGIKSAGVFFVGSLSFQVIQFSDRFMIDVFHGKKMVGIYTTYAQFTNAIEIFTFTAITMVTYPKMIKAFDQKTGYLKVRSSLFNQLLLMSLFLIVMMFFLAPYILSYLEKDSVIDQINTFYILLTGVFFLIMSNVYHYDLYVKKQDGIILKSALIGMIMNVTMNVVLIPEYSVLGAAISTGLTFLIILFIKYYYSKGINDTSRLYK